MPSARARAAGSARWRGGLLALLAWISFPLLAGQSGPAPDFAAFQALLDEHLHEQTLPDGGLVSAFDYAAALHDPATLERIREQEQHLAAFDPETLETREEAVAFWINAYNFFMLAHILEEGADGELVGSVRDFGWSLDPFRVFRQERFEVGGRKLSLDTIEKDILLGEAFAERGWKDARVHFAVNCASVGCPPLRESLYTPDNLDALLTENTRRAFNTARHLRVEGDTLHLTQLFEWYEDDFVAEAGSVRAWIARWADDEVAARVAQTTDIAFIDYDWALNRPRHFAELRP